MTTEQRSAEFKKTERVEEHKIKSTQKENARFKIDRDYKNKDIPQGMDRSQAYQYYMELYNTILPDFKSLLPKTPVENVAGRSVVRCDLTGLGLKAIGAEKMIASLKSDVLVYCAPRQGHAPLAIAELGKLYGKKVVMFAPASKEVSLHQACTIALGADLRFVKIAAMPVLNKYAKTWAEENNATFLPFGLTDTPLVTAGLVNFGDELAKEYGSPEEFWCAVSTGTMTRAMQIAWPESRSYGIAVARNIHKGEIGIAEVKSSNMAFLKESSVQPPFPTTAAYDAKAWEPCLEYGSDNSWFINVGSDETVKKLAATVDIKSIKSQREWHDLSDLNRGL